MGVLGMGHVNDHMPMDTCTVGGSLSGGRLPMSPVGPVLCDEVMLATFLCRFCICVCCIQ